MSFEVSFGEFQFLFLFIIIILPIFIFMIGFGVGNTDERNNSYPIIFDYYRMVCNKEFDYDNHLNIDCTRFSACNTIYSDVTDVVSCYNEEE